MSRKYECTFCKTVTPSLLFSSSPNASFPTEHHVRPSPPKDIAAAQAGADKLEKGKVWYEGLTLPGTLDLNQFKYVDKKLGVVFEDEELVRYLSKREHLLMRRWNKRCCCCGSTAPLQNVTTWPKTGRTSNGIRSRRTVKSSAGCAGRSCPVLRMNKRCTRRTCYRCTTQRK